ncbi:MAG TPA: TlpA disulfide reductase family protein [Polyangia bacterium]|jgi:thiol-disulfide isomerase/thioredoxin|nr:TlpA disulfide reductase family protein [Polyangia bacterium]
MHLFVAAAVMAAALQSGSVAVGDPAPALAAVTPDGAAVAARWVKGDVGVVMFFATWCGPCHRALRELGAIRQTLGPHLRLVLVEAGDDPAEVRQFLAQNPIPEGAVVATDPSGTIRSRWGCKIIPSLFIIDGAGTVRYINHGWGETTQAHLLRRLHNVLGDTP